MSSTRPPDHAETCFDLARDVPTTAEYIAALSRASMESRQVGDYQEFLALFGEASPEELRARPGPRGESPFEL